MLDDLHDFIVCLFTPFDSNGDIDWAAVKDNVDFTLKIPACGGLYFGSIYQEFWTLTYDERRKLMECVGQHLNGRAPLIANVSSPSYKETIELAKVAKEAGADYLMVWPPYWGPRSTDGVRRYYHKVAESVDLPFFIYTTTLSEFGFYLDIDAIVQLIDEIPSICGLKEGSGNITTFLSLTAQLGDRIAVGTPFEEYWAIARSAYPDRSADFVMGASRPMYMQSVDRPYLKTMLDNFRHGSVTSGFETFESTMEAVAAQMRAFRAGVHPVSMVKYACGLLGQKGALVRPPTPELTTAEKAEVEQLLLKMGLISSGSS